MSNGQDADNIQLDELLQHRKQVERQKELDSKEHIKRWVYLESLRNILVNNRRLLVEKLRIAPNSRQGFLGRSTLAVFIETQAAIDAIDRALPEEKALQKDHKRWSLENDSEFDDAQARLREPGCTKIQTK
jgi:abortive infection bacteriophage resistance protein